MQATSSIVGWFLKSSEASITTSQHKLQFNRENGVKDTSKCIVIQ